MDMRARDWLIFPNFELEGVKNNMNT